MPRSDQSPKIAATEKQSWEKTHLGGQAKKNEFDAARLSILQ
jgi:hypothetical protein